MAGNRGWLLGEEDSPRGNLNHFNTRQESHFHCEDLFSGGPLEEKAHRRSRLRGVVVENQRFFYFLLTIISSKDSCVAEPGFIIPKHRQCLKATRHQQSFIYCEKIDLLQRHQATGTYIHRCNVCMQLGQVL
jgi:hypothetical protein